MAVDGVLTGRVFWRAVALLFAPAERLLFAGSNVVVGLIDILRSCRGLPTAITSPSQGGVFRKVIVIVSLDSVIMT